MVLRCLLVGLAVSSWRVTAFGKKCAKPVRHIDLYDFTAGSTRSQQDTLVDAWTEMGRTASSTVQHFETGRQSDLGMGPSFGADLNGSFEMGMITDFCSMSEYITYEEQDLWETPAVRHSIDLVALGHVEHVHHLEPQDMSSPCSSDSHSDSPIHYIVLGSFSPEMNQEQKEQFLQASQALPSIAPQIASLNAGFDLGALIGPNSPDGTLRDIGLFMVFCSAEDLSSYESSGGLWQSPELNAMRHLVDTRGTAFSSPTAFAL